MREFAANDMIAAAEAALESAKAEQAKAKEKLAALQEQTAIAGSPKESQQSTSDEPSDAHRSAAVFLDDSFDKAAPEVWKPLGGRWEHGDGRLAKRRSSAHFRRSSHERTIHEIFTPRWNFVPPAGQSIDL